MSGIPRKLLHGGPNLLWLAGLLSSTVLGGLAAGASPPKRSASVVPSRVAGRFANLPLSFEANAGQASGEVKFLARGSGYDLYLCGGEAVLTTRRGTAHTASSGVVRMQLAGADRAASPRGEEPLPGTVNYFLGSDPADWRTGISTWAKVRYPGVYPGIDLVYYGNRRKLEYDFVVAPSADPKAIRLRLAGARRLRLTTVGNLAVTTAGGALRFHKPAVYQVVDGQRKPVAGRFTLLGGRTVGFRLGRYDRARPLVIDPVLLYSTYLGGSSTDSANAIAVDASGDVYVAGQTSSTGFPVSPGAFQTGSGAAFLTKFNPSGTAILYSTYLGGTPTQGDSDGVTGIALDGSGNAYVTGHAYSSNFPVTPGAFQTTNKAAANGDPTVFLSKLNATGTALVYSSYLGGSGSVAEVPFSGDFGKAIAVDAAGNAYVTGETYSTDFPVTSGAFQSANKAGSLAANAFVAKMNPAGSALVYSTYLGGSGNGLHGNPQDAGNAIALDSAGDALVAGQTVSTNFPVTPGAFQTASNGVGKYSSNAFIAELNPAGSALVYSTYLGGSSSDSASGVAVDRSGNAYVAGSATSTNFPVTPGAFQTTNQGGPQSLSNVFVAKLNPTGTALVYSTYLGGSGGQVWLMPTLGYLGGDQASGIAVDSAGDAYITGSTASSNFPVTPGAYQPSNNDQTAPSIGGYNAFATELNPAGTALVYSTYLGGNGLNPFDFVGVAAYGQGDQANGLALDPAGNVYVAGSASSSDFPVTQGSFQIAIQSAGNAFVAKLNLGGASTTLLTPTVAATPVPAVVASAQPVTVTVAVSGSGGNPVPTGTVTLASGTYLATPATLSGGTATFQVPAGALTAESVCYYQSGYGPDLLTANYIPDAASSPVYNFASTVSPVEAISPCFTVTPAVTNLTTTQAQSQPLSVAVANVAATGLPVPTGSVNLSAGSYTSPAMALAGGNANLTIPAGTLSAGFNILYLNFLGDSNYAPEPQAGSALVTVGTSTGSGFTLFGPPVTLSAGATAGNTSNLTVQAFGVFAGSVALTASIASSPSGAIDPPTLSFGTTSPVSVGRNGIGAATLIIATTAPSGCTASESTRDFRWYGGAGALACVFLLGFPARRRGRGRLLAALLLLVALAGAAGGCGGGGGGGSCNPAASGTTPGVYTIAVTGASGTTTAATTFSLTVTAR